MEAYRDRQLEMNSIRVCNVNAMVAQTMPEVMNITLAPRKKSLNRRSSRSAFVQSYSSGTRSGGDGGSHQNSSNESIQCWGNRLAILWPASNPALHFWIDSHGPPFCLDYCNLVCPALLQVRVLVGNRVCPRTTAFALTC